MGCIGHISIGVRYFVALETVKLKVVIWYDIYYQLTKRNN